MGKYIRKCKGLGEVAVMEAAQVGVRTRARAMAMAMAMAAGKSGTQKRRKVGSEELRFSSSLVQLGSQGPVISLPENSVSPTASSGPCASLSSGHVPASCCSSNGSTEVAKESLKFTDLEESVEIETSRDNLDRRERRETTPTSCLQTESGELESTEKPSEVNSRGIRKVEKMPPEAEIEEFFAAAESGELESTAKQPHMSSRRISTVGRMPHEAKIEEFLATVEREHQKQFEEKYNYDFVMDVPLEGRYEWVRLKP